MFSAKARRQLPLHLMVLPSLVLVLIFSYGPIGGLVIAFQKFSIIKGILDSPFNGLDNFRYMLQLPEIGTVVRNTLVIACMKIVAGLAVPIVVSLLLNELRLQLFKRWIQTMIYLPHFLSWIILGGILIDILSPSQGIINQLLGAFGIEPVFSSAMRAGSRRSWSYRTCGRNSASARSFISRRSPASIPRSTRQPSSTARTAGSRRCTSRCPA